MDSYSTANSLNVTPQHFLLFFQYFKGLFQKVIKTFGCLQMFSVCFQKISYQFLNIFGADSFYYIISIMDFQSELMFDS